MSSTIRKRLGLLSMVMSIAIIGLVAAFIAVGSATAQEGGDTPPPPPSPPPPPVTQTMTPTMTPTM